MILSRTLAKGRIARGERPTWRAAWLPVAFDALCLALVFILGFRPFQHLTDSMNFPTWATIAALFGLGFIPIQVVLISSSLWASKSRFKDEDAV